MSNPTEDNLEQIIQDMLLQYTDWVNGQPLPWNVKKAEGIAKIRALIKELLLSCTPDTNRTFGKNIKMCHYCTEPIGNKSVCDCIEKSQVDAVVAEFIKNIEELF